MIDGKTLEIKAKFTIASAVLTEDFKHISIEAAEKFLPASRKTTISKTPAACPKWK
ncbi:MAG: hypothetical protein ACLR06_13225 [Christensenellaceae bacterium]